MKRFKTILNSVGVNECWGCIEHGLVFALRKHVQQSNQQRESEKWKFVLCDWSTWYVADTIRVHGIGDKLLKAVKSFNVDSKTRVRVWVDVSE